MDWIESILAMVIGNAIILGALAAAIVLITIILISILNTKSRRLRPITESASKKASLWQGLKRQET